MIGKTILHYKIEEKLGEGGMGVVYKAEDTKLERSVALKFLSQSLTGGKEENERFKREAKAAAALNHANIAHIYAIDESDGQMFIAMEYVEGQSLEEMINIPLNPPSKGDFKKSPFEGGAALAAGGVAARPLPIEEAIDTATQIAAGLQAAHEKGIIHRDIKSANIMVTDKGVVKIMDFGLAKLANRSKMTVQGTTLGTAAYMSPEQAQGQKVDHRSDIWSLGVVLYEMISGQMPFKGDYEQAVIYSILHEEPEPLTALRSGLPIALDGIIAKALAKDPKTRYQHVDELPADLKGLDTASLNRSRISAATQPFESRRIRDSKGSRLPWTVTALSLVAVVLALLFAFKWKEQASSQTVRVNLSALTSKNQSLLRTEVQALALSPDGNTLVYTLSEKGQSLLYLRTLNDFAAAPIKGSTNGRSPFFSPDGQWVGFLADGKIKKVPVAGGAVETICAATGFRGASWGPDNTIVCTPRLNSGLMAVSAMGGLLRQISTLDTTQLERTHRWPQVLPDGKWVLFTIGDKNNPNSYIDARLAMQSMVTGERHILNVRGEMARYVEPGVLIVARNGALLAAPFSLQEFKTTQPMVPVLENVAGDQGSGVSYFSVSRTGRLIYIPGVRNQDLELIWVDMQGKIAPLPLPPGAYSLPRLSPDATRLAVMVGQVGDDDYNIWLYNLKSSVFSRFTFGKRRQTPVWSPDGKKLYFSTDSGKNEGILVKPTDGSSAEALILPKRDVASYPVYVSPDGSKLILNQLGGPTEGSVLVFDLNKRQASHALFPSGFFSYGGTFSPDGRFLAYSSNETGTFESFVISFPDQKGKWQISSAGGLSPTWSPDGKELYYVSPLAKMMAVTISTDPVFSSGKPRELFDISQMVFPNNPLANYDISPDGKRFIMIRNTSEITNTQSFNVILNWREELQKRFAKRE